MTRIEKKVSDVTDSRGTVKKFMPHLEEMVGNPSTAATELFKLCARFVPPEDAGILTRMLIRHLGSFTDPKSPLAPTQRHDLTDAFSKTLRHFYDYVGERDKIAPGSGEAAHVELLAFAEDIKGNLSARSTAGQDIGLIIEKIKAKGALLLPPPPPPAIEKSSVESTVPASERPPVQTTAAAAQVTERKKPATVGQSIAEVRQIFGNLATHIGRRELARAKRWGKNTRHALRNAVTGPAVPTRDKGTDTKSDKGPKPPGA